MILRRSGLRSCFVAWWFFSRSFSEIRVLSGGQSWRKRRFRLGRRAWGQLTIVIACSSYWWLRKIVRIYSSLIGPVGDWRRHRLVAHRLLPLHDQFLIWYGRSQPSPIRHCSVWHSRPSIVVNIPGWWTKRIRVFERGERSRCVLLCLGGVVVLPFTKPACLLTVSFYANPRNRDNEEHNDG